MKGKIEMRKEVAFGIHIGMGMIFVILGFFGWLHTNYHLEKLSYTFELVGIDPNRHYLIADLNRLMWFYVFFIALGFVSLLAGVGIRVKGRKEVKT